MEATLHKRIAVLEAKVEHLLTQPSAQVTSNDWRSTVGMFADDPVMDTIQAEGQRLRQSERPSIERDNS